MSVCRCTEPEVLEVRTSNGFDVKLDPTPLTPLDELRALVAGRRTYTLYVVAGEVHPRSASKIRWSPAGHTPRATVHAQHEHPPPPDEAPTAPDGTPTPTASPTPRKVSA